MAGKEVFDSLVSVLSLEERQNLLLKMKNQSDFPGDLLCPEDKETVSGADLATAYSRLPWFLRLWYFIQGLIMAKTPVAIFGDRQVSLLGAKIDEKSPGQYDFRKAMLLPAFFRQMEKLKDAARFFFSALDTSVNRDKGAFFAFLGSLEMPEVHKRLQAETDPLSIAEKHPDSSELELRQTAFKAMDDALAAVTEDNRQAMYSSARSLKCLKELSSFYFDRVLKAFGSGSSPGGVTCSAGSVRDSLVSLNNILHSLRDVPPMPLLESLFVFSVQERIGETGFDFNREMRLLLVKAGEALTVIREFNRQTPLTWIIRCSARDMSVMPREISGGEDWFAVYRDYWKRRVESLLGDFFRERRHRELLNSFLYFFRGTNLKPLGNIASDSNPDGIPVKGSFALSFINTFYSVVFMPETNKILRPILIDGEFAKKENRAEFAESYNNLIKLENDIKKFETEIAPDGDLGKRYAQARQELTSLPVRRRKIQIVIDDAVADADKILEQARDASRNIVNILGGILGRETRSKYDTLANLQKMADRDSRFMPGLEEALLQLQRFLGLLDDIEAMENGR